VRIVPLEQKRVGDRAKMARIEYLDNDKRPQAAATVVEAEPVEAEPVQKM